MGSRGPLRNPNSQRGQRERRKGKRASAPRGATPEQPAWLPAEAEGTWDAVLCDLQAAGVPLQRIDGHAIAFYCTCIEGARKAAQDDDPKLVARFSRDAIAWGNLIGATPAARARMGIRPEQPEPIDPLAEAIFGDPELDAILTQPRIKRA